LIKASTGEHPAKSKKVLVAVALREKDEQSRVAARTTRPNLIRFGALLLLAKAE